MKPSFQNRRLRLVNPANAEAASSPAKLSEPEVSPSNAVPSPLDRTRPAESRFSQPVRRGTAAFADFPDEQLVALGLTGNVRALEALYRKHAAFALHLAIRISGSTRDAEDVVHDSFVKAFEKLSELSDGSLFKAWLGSILVHAIRSRMRRARVMKTLGLGHADPVELDAVASPAASPLVRAQIAQVYALLQTLPTDERIAWTLRAVEGHELETVAQLTRCSLATVKRRISRAQQWLDDHFVEAQVEEGSS